MVLETKSNTKESEREMNANELADYVDKCNAHDDEKLDQAADMLRQQQAEIESLKAPKELTIDEIYEICEMFEESIWDASAIDFARAILKKASEK